MYVKDFDKVENDAGLALPVAQPEIVNLGPQQEQTAGFGNADGESTYDDVGGGFYEEAYEEIPVPTTSEYMTITQPTNNVDENSYGPAADETYEDVVGTLDGGDAAEAYESVEEDIEL